MAPIYLMECPKCGEREEIFCHHSMKNCFTCTKCDEKLEVIPSAANWKIEGYKAKNNYE